MTFGERTNNNGEESMRKLIFIDVESTSLRPERRTWDIALLAVDGTGTLTRQWFVDVADLDLGNADPKSLEVGGFYGRHPRHRGHPQHADAEVVVLEHVERLTRGATLVGACPWFDAETLDRRMRAHGICPSWHHRLRCVESLTAGRLGHEVGGLRACAEALDIPVDAEKEHTALGDARLAKAIWDRVMDGAR